MSLIEDIKKIRVPSKTPANAWRKDSRGLRTVYPNAEKTKRFNLARRREERAEKAAALYRQILITKSTAGKATLRTAIESLRPTEEKVKAYYSSRGDSPETINLLVRNYEHLPMVCLSLAQQQALLKALADNTKHQKRNLL